MYLLQVTNEVINSGANDFLEKFDQGFFVRLGIDLITTFLLIKVIYFKNYKRSENLLTFFALNVVLFLITFLLNKVEMTMGAAFGLFAVFSMLRYRTENISTKDMTYIFVVIATGLVMAVSKGGWPVLALMGFIIVSLMALLESGWLIKKESAPEVHYDRIELVGATKREELIADLKNRTGLNISRVEVLHIDFLKDSARLMIYFN